MIDLDNFNIDAKDYSEKVYEATEMLFTVNCFKDEEGSKILIYDEE